MLGAPLARIRDALHSAPQLPDWSPAILRVTCPRLAVAGTSCELVAIRGTLIYPQVQDWTIEFSWRVPMLSEQDLWQLQEQTQGRTIVTHSVSRQDALVLPLAHTLPEFRLTRLVESMRTYFR